MIGQLHRRRSGLLFRADQFRLRWIDRGTEHLSLQFATRIRAFNRGTLGMLAVLSIYLCGLLSAGKLLVVATLLPAFVWLSAVPSIVHRQHFTAARALTVVIVNATIFALAMLLGRGPGVQCLFFATVVFPLGIYEAPRERPAVIFGLLVPIVAGLVFAHTSRSYPASTADNSSYPLLMITTFFLIVQPVWAFGREMLGYQELLRTVNKTVNAETARREQLERQLENTRRVEALGELAAGLAHEINTPLQYVTDSLGFLDRTGQRLLSFTAAVERLMPHFDERHRSELEALAKRIKLSRLGDERLKAWISAEEGLARVSELVVAMKALANPSGERLDADVNQIISNAALVTRGTWSEVADLKLELEPELPHAEVVAGELGQVFVHLIVNAADAIRDKAGPTPGTIHVRSRARAGRIEVEIEDDGCGIPDAIKDRVFEPFFTTKEVGRGSGQGLSLTYTSVLRHGGELSFDSTPGVGTVFRMALPLAAAARPDPGRSAQAANGVSSP